MSAPWAGIAVVGASGIAGEGVVAGVCNTVVGMVDDGNAGVGAS